MCSCLQNGRIESISLEAVVKLDIRVENLQLIHHPGLQALIGGGAHRIFRVVAHTIGGSGGGTGDKVIHPIALKPHKARCDAGYQIRLIDHTVDTIIVVSCRLCRLPAALRSLIAVSEYPVAASFSGRIGIYQAAGCQVGCRSGTRIPRDPEIHSALFNRFFQTIVLDVLVHLALHDLRRSRKAFCFSPVLTLAAESDIAGPLLLVICSPNGDGNQDPVRLFAIRSF